MNKKVNLTKSSEPKKNNNKYFICQKCKYFPKIDFISFDKATILCKNCNTIENCYLKYIFKNNIFSEEEEKDNEQKNNFKKNCLKCHDHELKYKFYCEKCNKDICKKCCLENNHCGHKLIIFDSIIFETNVKIESIKDFLKANDINQIYNDSSFEELITIIINQYKQYPCHYMFGAIENIYQLIKNNNKSLIYYNYKKVKDNINDSIQSITLINQNIEDISKITLNKNLSNLEILELQYNNINDLSPLKQADLKNLKHLNLSNNLIDDKNFDYLKNANLKKLFYLDLCSNNLCNFSLFEKIMSFPKLSYLFVSSNKFNEKNIDRSKNIVYDLSHLKEIGLSNGVFSERSISLLGHFKLDNLKIIYLNNNGLKASSFIENLQCPNLEEIWLNNNNLSDFEPLTKLSNLKRIEINNNNINDIKKLGNFVNKLKNLKKLNIKGNKIELQSENNNIILEEIKKKSNVKILYKNIDF
jgi:Leucine-rich repeat (LRR) protein